MTRDLDKVCNTNTQIINDTTTYRKCSFPMAPHVRLLVGRLDGSSVGLLVGLSVCYDFQKGRKLHFHASIGLNLLLKPFRASNTD